MKESQPAIPDSKRTQQSKQDSPESQAARKSGKTACPTIQKAQPACNLRQTASQHAQPTSPDRQQTHPVIRTSKHRQAAKLASQQNNQPTNTATLQVSPSNLPAGPTSKTVQQAIRNSHVAIKPCQLDSRKSSNPASQQIQPASNSASPSSQQASRPSQLASQPRKRYQPATAAGLRARKPS
jgi:hypothetical protein